MRTLIKGETVYVPMVVVRQMGECVQVAFREDGETPKRVYNAMCRAIILEEEASEKPKSN